MKKHIISWVLLLILVSGYAGHAAIGQAKPGDFKAQFPRPTPAEATDPEVPYIEMTAESQKKINELVVVVNEIWNTQQFKDAVSSANYKHYGNNDDRPSSHVFDVITASHPKFLTYYLCDLGGNALASTNPETGKTCFDPSYLARSSTADMVDTISHEFTHTPAGGSFKHWYLNVPGRSRTVSYLVGDLAWDIANSRDPNKQGTEAMKARFVVKDVDPANLHAFRKDHKAKKKQ